MFTQGSLRYQHISCFGLYPGLGINLPLGSYTINGYFEFTTTFFDASFIAGKGYWSEMIHVMWHRRSCASFALLNTVFTSV